MPGKLVSASRQSRSIRLTRSAERKSIGANTAKPDLLGRDDRLVKVAPMLAMVSDWRALLDSAMAEEDLKQLRAHSGTGHPLGSSAFIEALEKTVGRILRPRKPGRRQKLLKQPK